MPLTAYEVFTALHNATASCGDLANSQFEDDVTRQAKAIMESEVGKAIPHFAFARCLIGTEDNPVSYHRTELLWGPSLSLARKVELAASFSVYLAYGKQFHESKLGHPVARTVFTDQSDQPVTVLLSSPSHAPEVATSSRHSRIIPLHSYKSFCNIDESIRDQFIEAYKSQVTSLTKFGPDLLSRIDCQDGTFPPIAISALPFNGQPDDGGQEVNSYALFKLWLDTSQLSEFWAFQTPHTSPEWCKWGGMYFIFDGAVGTDAEHTRYLLAILARSLFLHAHWRQTARRERKVQMGRDNWEARVDALLESIPQKVKDVLLSEEGHRGPSTKSPHPVWDLALPNCETYCRTCEILQFQLPKSDASHYRLMGYCQKRCTPAGIIGTLLEIVGNKELIHRSFMDTVTLTDFAIHLKIEVKDGTQIQIQSLADVDKCWSPEEMKASIRFCDEWNTKDELRLASLCFVFGGGVNMEIIAKRNLSDKYLILKGSGRLVNQQWVHYYAGYPVGSRGDLHDALLLPLATKGLHVYQRTSIWMHKNSEFDLIFDGAAWEDKKSWYAASSDGRVHFCLFLETT